MMGESSRLLYRIKKRMLGRLPRAFRERAAMRLVWTGQPGDTLLDVKLDRTPAILDLSATDCTF
jgi:hypothetical protein